MAHTVPVYATDVDKRLEFLLREIYRLFTADIVCIFTEHRDAKGLQLTTLKQSEQITPEMWETFAFWLDSQLSQLNAGQNPQIRKFPEKKELLNGSVLIWPLATGDMIIGALVIYRSQSFSDDVLDILDAPVGLLHAFLENMHLTERLITTEAVAQTARAIARNPSLQNIVHILRDYLFDVHISTCAIALFGPVQPGHPNTFFEYLEVQGAWSRRLGSKVGLGMRYQIDPDNQLMGALEREKLLIFRDLQDIDDSILDDFSRMMLRVDRIETLTLLLLQTDTQNLGVIAIASDHPHEFSPHELRSYQIVAEFLTMSTMAAALRQQADFVQQGRAALLDAVTDGVVMVLPGEAATVLTVNKQFTVLFGLRENEVQGLSLWQLLDRMPIPVTLRRNLRKRWQKVDTANAFKGTNEFNLTMSNGAERDIEWYSAPVYQDEQVLGHIYIFHDITSERVAERLRSQLLSRISHELRTPLTSIRGFAEFILEVDGDNLPDTAREYTEIIHKSAIHLNHLFTDLIELTRANVGELKLNREMTSLARVVTDVVKRMEPQYREKQQQILIDIEAKLPEVYIDKDRIDQVLTNLISNAVKYSPVDAKISLRVSCAMRMADLSEYVPQGVIIPCVVVSVIDEGQGLTTEEATRVFLPFYRTKDAHAGKIEGAGLGLAISHSIVELHDGRIWVEPSTRKTPGGRFFFTIPLGDPS